MHSRIAGLALLLLLAGVQSAQAAITDFPLSSGVTAPGGITTGPDGNLWVALSGTDRLARVTPTGTVTEFVVPAGREPFEITSFGGSVWFTERTDDRIGRINPNAGTDAGIQGSIVEFAVPGSGSRPTDIAAGSDGALWFTQSGGDQIGRITTIGTVTNEFSVPGTGSRPHGIAAGPDGALWFTQPGSGEVARLTTAGVITEFPVPSVPGTSSRPGAITTGPDGELWFVDPGTDHVRRITTAGAQSQFAAPVGSRLEGIAAGPDGNLWVTEERLGKIARMTTSGAVSEFSTASVASGPSDIAVGPDGALWFSQRFAGRIGRITTDSTPDVPPAGPPAPSGGAATPGPAGPAAQAKLVLVAFQVTPSRPRAGRRLKVRFAITDGASVVLQVKRGRAAARTVARKTVTRAGIQTLAWNGKIGRRAAPRGLYTLTVQATKDGQSVSSRLRVRLR
jgi:virginiamycin B lyase